MDKENARVDLTQEASFLTQGISKNSNYQLELIEGQRVVANPNTLQFKNEDLEAKYNKQLFGRRKMVNDEFKWKFIRFFSLIYLVLIFILLNDILQMIKGKLDLFYGFLSIGCNFAIQTILIIILIAIWNWFKARLATVYLLSFIMIIFQGYIIFFDKNFLKDITDRDISGKLDHSLVIFGNVYLTYQTLFSNYFGIFIVSFFTCVFYFIVQIFKDQDIQESIFNILILIFMCMLILQKSYQKQVYLKKIFVLKKSEDEEEYRVLKEQVSMNLGKANKNQDKSENGFFMGKIIQMAQSKTQNNEMDKITIIIVKIILILKKGADLIMFTDFRNQLFDSIQNLEYVLKTLFLKENLFQVNLEKQMASDNEITEDDKQWFQQQYQLPQVSLLKMQSVSEKNKSVVRRSSLMQFSAKIEIPQVLFETSEIKTFLKKIGFEWNFDVFFLDSISNKTCLSTAGSYIFENLIQIKETFGMDLSLFQSYLKRIELLYKENPYHNRCHGIDVTNSFLYFILNSHLKEKLDNIDNLGGTIACLGHDLAHPGLNNRFLINDKSDLAITYNDISVLENMHSSLTFKAMQQSENANILKSLNPQDYIYIRKLIIQLILETDMSKHFDSVAKFKTKAIDLIDEFQIDDIENKLLVLSTAVKCADIGHASKE